MGLIIRLCLAGLLVSIAGIAGLLILPADDDLPLSLSSDEAQSSPTAEPEEPDEPEVASTPISTMPLPADTARIPRGPCAILGVVKTRDGRPAAAAKVSIRLVKGSRLDKKQRRKLMRPLYVHSHGDGRFYFRRLPEGVWSIDVHDENRSLAAPEIVRLAEGSREADLDLRLDRGRELVGQVKASDGEGVGGVRLVLEARKAGEDRHRDPIATREVVTDAEGGFRFWGLRSGSRFRLGAKHARYYLRKPRSLTLERDTRLDLALAAYASISGVVRREDGTPVSGAQLELLGRPGVSSDENGRFIVGDVIARKKPMQLLAATPDLDLVARLRVLVKEGETREDLVVVLRKSARIRGRVRDVTGAGVPHARVTVSGAGAYGNRRRRHAWREFNSASTTYLSNVGGRFEVVDYELARGASLKISRSGPSQSQPHGLPGSTGKLLISNIKTISEESVGSLVISRHERSAPVVELAQAACIGSPGRQGIVFGKPRTPDGPTMILSLGDVASRTEDIVLVSGEVAASTWGNAWSRPAPLSERLSTRQAATTDAEGFFEIRGLPLGRFSVAASRTGFMRGHGIGVDLTREGEVHDLDLLVHRGAQVKGHIVRSDGGSDGKWVIKLRNLSTGRTTSNKKPWCDEFLMTNLPAGTYELVARAEPNTDLVFIVEKLKLELDHVEDGLILELSPGAQISGVVRDSDGIPVTGAAIKVTSLQKRGTLKSKSGEQGLYDVRGLLPGRYHVEISRRGFVTQSLERRLSAHGHEILDVTLRRTTTLSGVVSVPGSVSRKGVFVFLHTKSKTSTVSTDSEGRFKFKNIEEGDCRVYSRTRDQTWNALAEFEVNARDGQRPLELFLHSSCTSEGQVVDTLGNGVPGVTVTAVSIDNSRVKREAKTGADGTFAVKGLYEGAYTLRVKGRRSVPQRVSVRSGTSSRCVTLRLGN